MLCVVCVYHASYSLGLCVVLCAVLLHCVLIFFRLIKNCWFAHHREKSLFPNHNREFGHENHKAHSAPQRRTSRRPEKYRPEKESSDNPCNNFGGQGTLYDFVSFLRDLCFLGITLFTAQWDRQGRSQKKRARKRTTEGASKRPGASKETLTQNGYAVDFVLVQKACVLLFKWEKGGCGESTLRHFFLQKACVLLCRRRIS